MKKNVILIVTQKVQIRIKLLLNPLSCRWRFDIFRLFAVLSIFIFISINQLSCSFASAHNLITENSVGKLLLLHDNNYSYQTGTNPFGSAEIFKEFLIIYNEKIKRLPVSERMNFFWASMWHLGFDGHYMEEFQNVIIHDCGKKFIERLQKYTDEEKVLKRDRSRLYLSEKVLFGLKELKKHYDKGDEK